MNLRYQAFTLDGGLIFSADTAQRIGDKVAEHIERQARPAIGYTLDNAGGAFPYTVWRASDTPPGVVGIPCESFDKVCTAWGRA